MKRLLPVIHVENESQAFRQMILADNCGADGVFLIHHRRSHKILFEISNSLHKKASKIWIGVNALDLTACEAVNKAPAWANAIWVDDIGVFENEDLSFNTEGAEAIVDARVSSERYPEIFGGFAFKYQKPVSDLRTGATLASNYADIVTTSGDGTGLAADIEKIRQVRNGIDNYNERLYSYQIRSRLGIASGITPENVGDYLPYVDDFLVATGISKDEYNFDVDKLKALRAAIK